MKTSEKTAEIGRTFTVVDPATGRSFIGFGSELDEAIADAMAQWKAATAATLRVRYLVQSYCTEGVK